LSGLVWARMLQTGKGSSGLARPLALALVVLSGVGALGLLGWNALWRGEIAFLPRRSPAEWIIYPAVPEGLLHARLELSTQFKRSFVLERVPSHAELRVAALHSYALLINGAAPSPPTRSGHNWKQADRYEVAPLLRVGENQIAVTVFNTNGPPALWLCLRGPGLELCGDQNWQASYAGATWRSASLASGPKIVAPGNQLYGRDPPWASLQGRWPLLMLFIGLSAGGDWLLRRWTSEERAGRRFDGVLILVLACAWVALFANNLGSLPNILGFDVTGHLAYIRYIQEHGALPMASQGWEMSQPPLYYVICAGLLEMLSLSVADDAGIRALRILGLGIGVAHFVIVWASLRLLFPGERSRQMWGLALAALLPPLLYLSQYVTNEALAAALVSTSVYLALRMLKQEHFSWKSCAGLGFCLGAALLTKTTAVLAVAVIVGALLWKAWLTPRSGGPQGSPGALQVGLLLGVCVFVCGWHYARVWANYGSPFIGGWEPQRGVSWWQDPGYRTGGFYVNFGEALRHPWFRALQSFGDGIYATLWGDGQLGGGGVETVRCPPWSYDLMYLGYWLALVPTAGVLVGCISAVGRFLRAPAPEWFLVLGLGFLVALAMVHMSLAVPYYSIVKAFYGLSALVPLCAFGALGLDLLCRWSGKLRPVVCILFIVWALDTYASFWIPRGSVAALLGRARSLAEEGRPLEAKDLLQSRLQAEPGSAETGAQLALMLLITGDADGAEREAKRTLEQQPNDASAHRLLSEILARQPQQLAEAAAHARRAVELEPGGGPNYEHLASLLGRQGHYKEAIGVAREGLRVASFSSELRLLLGANLVSNSEAAEGISQLELACAMKPDWAEPQVTLGAALAGQGDLEAATQHLREAVRLAPTNTAARCQLAGLLSAQKQPAEAVAQYAEALRLEPDCAEALNNLAWVRAAHPQAEFRDGAEAVRLAEQACELTQYHLPLYVGTLAAAYAEAGRFDEAVTTAGKARDLALAAGQKELAEKNLQLSRLYATRQPYREGDGN
jgi:tetratricopeptide (TPR) repeat protein